MQETRFLKPNSNKHFPPLLIGSALHNPTYAKTRYVILQNIRENQVNKKIKRFVDTKN